MILLTVNTRKGKFRHIAWFKVNAIDFCSITSRCYGRGARAPYREETGRERVTEIESHYGSKLHTTVQDNIFINGSSKVSPY